MQSGRCFDVYDHAGDVFDNIYVSHGMYDATTLETHTRNFAGKVIEGLEAGLNMTCSSVEQGDQDGFTDALIAAGAIKAF